MINRVACAIKTAITCQSSVIILLGTNAVIAGLNRRVSLSLSYSQLLALPPPFLNLARYREKLIIRSISRGHAISGPRRVETSRLTDATAATRTGHRTSVKFRNLLVGHSPSISDSGVYLPFYS